MCRPALNPAWTADVSYEDPYCTARALNVCSSKRNERLSGALPLPMPTGVAAGVLIHPRSIIDERDSERLSAPERMEIRSGTAADTPQIAALHTGSWRTAYAGIMPTSYLEGPLAEEHAGLWRARLLDPGPVADETAETPPPPGGGRRRCADGRIRLPRSAG
ncbi:hypothetical protein [Streptomyces sp. NBC_01508]|uniref:hypothetical protein n=1 Tax=Streptomyces sp. NBC_01508 TaxID=2903888 RepID=UPI00386B333B